MDRLLSFFAILDDSASSIVSESGSGASGGTSDKITNALKGMVKSPIFYIVIGGLVLLIILVYLLRRFIKASPNTAKIVIRHGEIYKIVDESNPKYFLVPFADRIGAEISLNEKSFNSDKLFINNGPDALYKVNYTLKYKVNDPKEFYPHINGLQENMINSINDGLREFADKGGVMTIIKDYREKESELLKVINGCVNQYEVEVTSFKVNFIEPMGGK